MKKIMLLLVVAVSIFADTKILKQETIDLGGDTYILYTICKNELVYSMYKHIQTGNLVVNQEYRRLQYEYDQVVLTCTEFKKMGI